MTQLIFPTFRLDLDSELVLVADESVRLRPKSWAVLCYLAENPGRVVTKDELLDRVWHEVAVSEDMPRLCIGEIRKAIRDQSRGSTIIETVHGKGYRMLLRPRSSGGPPRTRLAVFRFVDHMNHVDLLGEPSADLPPQMSNPPASGGLHELASLLTRGLNGLLATYDDFDVAGSRSTHAAQDRHTDLAQQAAALGVATVLRGSCRRDTATSNNIEVIAELLDAKSGKVLWQRAFLRDQHDLVELQAHIADEVAEALRTEGQPSSSMIKLQRSTVSSVHHLYLRGLRLQDRYESAAWDAAERYYREATELDPQYAPAWAGLSAIALLRAHSGGLQLPTQFEEASRFATKALTLDPDLPDAHGHLGTIESLHRWNFSEAERRYRTALALRPSFSRVYFAYQTLLSVLGRHNEARAAGRRGYELEPLSTSMMANRGFAELAARAPLQALQIFEEAVEADPGNALARLGTAVAHRDLGHYRRALEGLERCRAHIAGPLVASLIGQVSALAGETSAAHKELGALSTTSEDGSDAAPPYTYQAIIQIALGKPKEAFELLDRAVNLRQSSVINLIDRAFDPIREDPRFAELVRTVGLPEAVAAPLPA